MAGCLLSYAGEMLVFRVLDFPAKLTLLISTFSRERNNSFFHTSASTSRRIFTS